MIIIFDSKHNSVKKSKSFRALREYVSEHEVKEVRISKGARNASGSLFIQFNDGSYSKINFASFNVLKGTIKRWVNLHGTQLYVNRKGAGKVSFKNPNLL